MFITFEGGEGTGKSTQVKLLAERLRAMGREVLATREPGGTSQGEQIRKLLVTGDTNKWIPNEEILLNYAARSAHIRSVIQPALLANKTVICDRFFDSTWVYQYFAGTGSSKLSDDLINFLTQKVVVDYRAVPDLTFILDIDPAVGILRSRHRMASQKIAAETLRTRATGSETIVEAVETAAADFATAAQEDRFEKMDIGFHQRVREGFIEVSKLHPVRCKLIDASMSIDEIQASIWAKTWSKLHG